ncbi:MAG: prepilin-type N-terminal cleavage/methylation domain-containing protein [Deltaproteobacteria bacterium]
MHKMKSKLIKNQKGFTAIELVIAITIITIVLGTFLEFVSKNYFMANKEAVNAGLNQEANVATEKVVGDMRKAIAPETEPTTTGIQLYADLVTDPAGEITTATTAITVAYGNLAVIRYETPRAVPTDPPTYTQVCYRKYDPLNNGSYSLIRYLLTDSPTDPVAGTYTGGVPTDPSKIDVIIGSLNTQNDASNNKKSVEEFWVELLSNNASDNFRKYNVHLKVTQGAGNYKTEVKHDVPIIKMKTPN